VKNNTMQAVWLMSVCRTSAVPAGFPAMRLLADGPAKLRQEKSARIPSIARLERMAAPIAYLPGVEGSAVVTTANRGQQPAKHDTKFANGGLRGSHPWRDPVKT
jgi:hypothetical protein